MIVRQLELQSFGRFQQEVFAFAPGMNLLCGPNESGKSTLLEAVPAVLFGVRDARRFVPWGGRDCRAALVLEASGRTVRIERDLLTDRVEWFEQDAAGFQPCFSGQVGPDGPDAKRADYHRRLQELLCPADESLLRTAFWFGQADPVANSPDQLAKMLRNTLAGTDGIDYHQVLDSLRQDYLAITQDNPWGLEGNGEGRLETVGRQLEDLEERWFAARQSRRELAALEQRSAQPEGAAEDPPGREDGISISSGEPAEAPAGHAEPDALAGSGPPSSEIAGRRQGLEAELAKTGLPRDIPAELPDLLAAASDIRQKLAELQRRLSAHGEELRRHGPPPWRLLTAALVLFWAGFVAWGVVRGWSGILGLSGFTATLVAAGWQGWRWWQRRTDRCRIEERIKVLERKQAQIREQRTSLDDRFEQCGFAVSAVEMVRMQKNLSRHRRLQEELRQLDEAENGAEETAAPLCAASASRQESAAMLPSSEGTETTRPQPVVPDELNARWTELRRDLACCRQIEAEGDYLRAQEAHLLRRRDVLGTACELLQGAIGEYGGFRHDRFAAVIGEYLRELTAARYGEVRLTADFDIQLGAPDGQWPPLSRCSGAMRHVVQLAVRLALGQHLAKGEGPPLLLDDVLTILDKKHRGLVLKTLEKLSTGRQVVLCSHDESLCRQAGCDGWQVVILGMAQGNTAGPVKERNNDGGQLSLL